MMLEELTEHFPSWAITAVVIVLCIIWAFNRATCGYCKSTARMDGKTVLITGCSSGLGEATALDLARRGARVIMASTNLEKNFAVRDKITAATNNRNIVVRQVDMSLMRSVRRFAKDLNDTEERLDVLIHNAGIYLPSKAETEEGLNTVLSVNVFGPFLLTHLLIDLIKKTGKSRIIFVSSNLHMFGNINLDNPNPSTTLFWVKFYMDSKFAVLLLANEMARRLNGCEVTVNSLHPGVVYTKIFGTTSLLGHLLLKLMNPIFFKTVDEGSQTTTYLAVSKEVEGVSGKYFTGCGEWFSASKTHNEDLAKKYWKICEDLVKLQPSDPHIK